MRKTFTTKIEGAGLSLYDIGITDSYDFDKKIGGKLKFVSDDNGAKLKEMIAQNPSGVEQLFTDEDNGFATLFTDAIDEAAKSSMGSPGYLVQMAGSSGLPDTSSKIYREIKDIDETLEKLEVKYNLEYSRYWKQFNNMEQVISNMNQQSSWLTQQFS